MATQKAEQVPRSGRITDARGRRVTQLDLVRHFLVHQGGLIPDKTMQKIVDELLPGARRKRLLQVLSVLLGILLVVGGNIIYFRFFSNWQGLDPVNVTIYTLQAILLLGGPIIAFRMARATYIHRVVVVMLKHRRCPHCAYDLRGSPPDLADGAYVCPECGCAWNLRGCPADGASDDG